MSIDLEEFARVSKRIWERAKKEGRLIENPSDEELKRLMEKEPCVKKTKYGNYVAESEPTSRAAMFTKNSIDHPFGEEELRLLTQCEELLSQERLISIDRIVGDDSSETTVRLIVPERWAHVAYGGGRLFIPVKKRVDSPDYQIIMFADESFEENKLKPLPEKDITIRLAMLSGGRVIKIVRNSNYIGEYKKGVFASEDWVAKTKRGGIFLHA
ncbi:MAG: phosphoenolpyruvate carboxykinase (ATP), partial [Candidatus Bathyarchaeia archaeon]